MSYKQRLDKIGATPGKLALIGVLVLMLILVIVKQLPEGVSEYADTSPTTAAQRTTKTEMVRPIKLPGKSSQNERELTSWPEIKISETLANNPFTPPSWVVQEEPAVLANNEDSGELAELQQQGASIVVIGQEEKSARIGDQKLHVGDILEGYRVTDITTQGIFLNKLGSQ